MRSIIKKIGSVLMAVTLVGGMFAMQKPVKAEAAESYTVEFYYTRADQDYDGYTIKAYTNSNSVGGETVTFEKKGDKGYCYYRFNRDPEIEELHFVIQTVDGSTTLLQYSCELLDSVDKRMQININGDTNDVTYGEVLYVGDDPNKDYSVGILQALVYDVVIFAIIGVGSYMVLGNDKKKKKKKA